MKQKELTPELQRQIQIVKQSQSKLAFEILNCRTDCKQTLQETLKLTELLVDYTFGDYDDVKNRIKKFDEYINQKYVVEHKK